MSDEYNARISVIPGLLADPDDEDAREFYEAAVAGDLDMLKELLIRNPDININAQHRQIPDSNDYAEIVLYQTAQWNVEASEAAINGAARNGHTDVVCLLLALGANVNSECTHDNELRTPLYNAMQFKHVDLVRVLLDHGADLSTKLFVVSGEELDYYHVCWTTRDFKILDLLLDYGGFDLNTIQKYGDPIREEFYARQKHIYRRVLFRVSFAFRAVQLGVKMLSWAISRGLIVSDELLGAVEPKDYEMLRYLVTDVGLRDSNFSLLSQMHRWRDYGESMDKTRPTVNLLLDTVPQDKMKHLPTVLCAAMEARSMDTFRFWLDWGVDVNGYSNRGLTPLHQTIVNSWILLPDFAKILLERGADVNSRTADYTTPWGEIQSGSNALHLSCGHKGVAHNDAQIDMYLAAGLDRDARNDAGSTPLHEMAAYIGRPKARNSFELRKAMPHLQDMATKAKDINATDNDGRTALHRISGRFFLPERKEAALILIRCGTSLDIKDKDGKTAEDVFRQFHDIRFKDWIEESLCEATSGGSIASS
ncbi:hypothetical protein MAPG_08657 [Magnaporthiopsis poae ATCC 64411]|uniref:Uncharacterized protein n=1 Tax=Magnaporthiopsis poae (strain ATCC 64411 / 73-15) TaxID=644358 RepID=A0A0C4E7X5_MAGP6|nr:hypothetical protein MAPG_08657 [Magnaporthiopsis poae ATCC 64411]